MAEEDKKLTDLDEEENPDSDGWVYYVPRDGSTENKVQPKNLAVISNPGPGEYKVVNIRLDANKKIVITYDEMPVP